MPSEVVNFARKNIYKAIDQDSQYHFKLIKTQKPGVTSRHVASIYDVKKYLPDETNNYLVYVIGQLNVNLFNLLRPGHEWYKDVWTNFADDANQRDINITIYTDKGRVVPKSFCYYSFLDEKTIAIIVKVDASYKRIFNYNEIKYVRFYSNAYFNSIEYNSLPDKIGLQYISMWVRNNVDKANIQNQITTLKSTYNGDVIVFCNGYYRDRVDLNIEDNSYLEVLFDQSIVDKHVFSIPSLHTYTSSIDHVNKYLLYIDDDDHSYMKFFDDYDFFIKTTQQFNNYGLYYYKHNESSCRMVTDKDYGLRVQYVNNHALELGDVTTGAIEDKAIVLYRRKSGLMPSLIYSSLKLHELYKVPNDRQLNVLCNNGLSLDDLRVETLEASDYFKLAQTDEIVDINDTLSTSALGYDSICYYMAYSPFKTTATSIDVPLLYQEPSTVFEYNADGVLLDYFTTTGPVYLRNLSTARYFEFLYGQTKPHLSKLYDYTETITLTHPEFKLYRSVYSGLTQVTNWVECHDYTVVNSVLSFNGSDPSEKYFILYYNEPIIYDIDVDINDGLMYFPLTFSQDRGNGVLNHTADIGFYNIEIFMNGYKLTKGLDYFMKFPYVNITNKKFITYSNSLQHIHIRMYGPTLDYTKINEIEEVGFVNHDVLSRNHKYDLRDDRVLSFFIDGKIQDRNLLKFAENDNTVRTYVPNNGKPYIIKQPFIPIKTINNISTDTLYDEYKEKNKRFSDFFTQIMPEPSINEFNVIDDKNYIFSPTLSKIIFDVLSGTIPSSLYMNPYNDNTILTLINSDYKDILDLDPIKYNLPDRLVEIHPHLGNTIIDMNLYQYRFINNVKRVILANMVNFSGYLRVST